MSYLIFPTRSAAVIADRRIAKNFGMADPGDMTTRYQSEREQIDGSWYLATPPPVVTQLPPVYTAGPDIATPDGPQPSGTWSYPTTQSDSLAGVSGYTRSDSVQDVPIAGGMLPGAS